MCASLIGVVSREEHEDGERNESDILVVSGVVNFTPVLRSRRPNSRVAEVFLDSIVRAGCFSGV